MGEYYSAKEAAKVLQLNYHTLLARVRDNPGKYKYKVMRVGWEVLFLKSDIDARAARNDTASETMEAAAR